MLKFWIQHLNINYTNDLLIKRYKFFYPIFIFILTVEYWTVIKIPKNLKWFKKVKESTNNKQQK
jgi:hypothetical protein